MAHKTTITSSCRLAASFIRNGELAAFPTETVYGLGASAFNARAVEKIFAAKGRPQDNPLIVHVGSKAQIATVASSVPPSARRIISNFFPGPVSVVLPKSGRIPKAVTAGLSTVCVRMPSSKTAREFIRLSGVPIAAPSANISGRPSPTTWRHVLHDLGGRIPCILRGPPCRHGIESTVIDCTGEVPALLRAGSLPIEKIAKVAGAIALPRGKSAPRSPGMKYRHYAPDARVVVVENAAKAPANGRNYAYIGFGKCHGARLSISVRNAADYARRLFAFMRKCDSLGIRTIYAQAMAPKGAARAVMERLQKACAR